VWSNIATRLKFDLVLTKRGGERGWVVSRKKLSLGAMMGHTHTNISLIEIK